MALRIHDPGHVALQRGIRAAIGVPLAIVAAMWILGTGPAELMAAFGALGLIATADFGGTKLRRLRSLIYSGAVGLAIIAIGVTAGTNIWSAIVVTFLVTAILSFVSVLHGSIASGAPVMTTLYVVAVALGVPVTELPTMLGGWLIGVAVSIPITLFLLPRRSTAPVRDATVQALRALADTVRRRAAGQPADVDALHTAQDALQRSYLGNPFRAAGFSMRDQSLQILAAQTQGLLAALVRGRGYRTPMSDGRSTLDLVNATASMFDATADALAGEGSIEPSGLSAAHLWSEQWDEATDLLSHTAPGRTESTVVDVSHMFPDRAACISAIRVTMLTRRVLGLPQEDYSTAASEHTIPEPPVPSPWLELRSHTTLQSPWARLALRTGVGLAIAVVIVHLMGLSHGFWVMLGVISVLRFDSLATVKMGLVAIAGTFLGALLGLGILILDLHHEGWLWIALALATFLATWAPGALGFLFGQAGFSLFVIVAFSLINWPPDLNTAGQRVIDITIGAVVSMVVATLMWPRGVLRGLLANIAEAITTGTDLLTEAITALIHGPTERVNELPYEANRAAVRAREVVDLTFSSKSSEAAAIAFQWQTLMDQLRTLMVSGHLIAGWSHDRPPIARFAPGLGPVLQRECAEVSSAWEVVASRIEGTETPDEIDTDDTLAEIARVAESLDLSAPDVADRVLAAIWGHGWLVMSLHAGNAAKVPVAH